MSAHTRATLHHASDLRTVLQVTSPPSGALEILASGDPVLATKMAKTGYQISTFTSSLEVQEADTEEAALCSLVIVATQELEAYNKRMVH